MLAPMVVSRHPFANDRKKHAVLPMAMAATCNQELNRLFHVAAPAANQQQTLAYRLLSQADPDFAMRAAARALDASSSPCRRRSKSLASIARTKVSTTAAILSASPRVIAPPASAEVTAFIAAAMSDALAIGAGRILPSARGKAAGCVRGTA